MMARLPPDGERKWRLVGQDPTFLRKRPQGRPDSRVGGAAARSAQAPPWTGWGGGYSSSCCTRPEPDIRLEIFGVPR